jgi:virginiamycin B lyase
MRVLDSKFRASLRAGIGRFAVSVTLLFVAGCGFQHAGFVPSRDLLQGRGRIVSSVVSAGGRSYAIEEIYTPSSSNLWGIAPGPNGLIWFTGDAVVGKSTVKSDMLEYLLPEYGNATSIAEGADQHVWVTLSPPAIGRFSTGGDFTALSIPAAFGGKHSYPYSITKGPDDALWFIANDTGRHIVRIDSTGKMQGHRVPVGSRPQWLTLGRDGALWFTDSGSNAIGRMTATGEVREFSVPTPNAGLTEVCQGPDGKLWFIEGTANKVGTVTTSGTFHEYDIPTPYSGAFGIAAGPDGALWFTETAAHKIGRITTNGSIIELKLAKDYESPVNITVGSDKNLWFAESEAYGIVGRVELHPVQDSKPTYSKISVSLRGGHPELGVPAKFPLTITAYNLGHHVINGQYPNEIDLTTSNPKNAGLSETVVKSSTSKSSLIFSGHYTDATIGANANGGGTIAPAAVLPSTQPEKKLPNPGYGLTRSSVGDLWICLGDGSIARYSKTGTVHDYPATTTFEIEGCSMVEGPDGNVWFTDYANDRVGKITPRGQVTFFQLSHDASPFSIALGSDGALWFTEYFLNQIGRITTDGRVRTFNAGATPLYIVAGPDGNLWYTDARGYIHKLATTGKGQRVRRVYELGAGLWTAEGNIWFYTASSAQLEEMSTTGAILKKYTVPERCLPFALTGGPQNSIWYVDSANDCVARMTLSGTFYTVPTYSQSENEGLFAGIVPGPNGDLWFTETGTSGLGWIDPRTI